MIPHLNELAAEFDPKRVMIVGVSDESRSLIEPYIEKHEVRYPVASVSQAVFSEYGVEGIPHAVIIGPDGVIKWRGSPGGPDGRKAHEILEQESKKVVVGLPKPYASIQRLLDRGDFGKAHVALVDALGRQGVSEDDRPLLEEARSEIEAEVKRLAESIQPALDGGVPIVAIVACERLANEFAGVPGAQSGAEHLAELRADEELKPEFSATRKFAEADALERAGDFEKARKAYLSIVKLYPKVSAGPEAERRAAALEGKKSDK